MSLKDIKTAASVDILTQIITKTGVSWFLNMQNVTYFYTSLTAALCFEYDSQPEMNFIGTIKAGINVKNLLKYLYCPV